MEPIGFVVMAVGGLVALGIRAMRGRGRSEAWKARAAACGLTDIEQGDRFGARGDVTGRRGRHEVRIQRFHRGKNVRGTRVVVRGLEGSLGLRSEGFGATIEKVLGGGELTFGDGPFDAGTYLRGSEVTLRALLDADTRALVSHALRGTFRGGAGLITCRETSVEVESGDLRTEFRDGFHRNDEPRVEILQALLALAERLSPVMDAEKRLAWNAREDPVPAVRGRALAVLAESFADGAETRAAMRAALSDPQPEIRLQAAVWLEDEGRATLAGLAAAGDVPDECSSAALDALGGPDEATRGILDSALRLDRKRTIQAALVALARAGDAHVDVLADALRDAREHVAVAAARALGATGSERAEAPLLAVLDGAPDAVREAAAVALGFVGTARSVMALKEVRLRGFWGADKAAREAVARIQERLVNAGPGQLALAGDRAGQVSLSSDASGQLELADDPTGLVEEAGRLALPDDPNDGRPRG